MSTLGERITKARESKGMLQSELAERVGVKSSGVISNWETNKNKPDAEKLVQLCKVLDVSLSFLLDYDGSNSFSVTPDEKEMLLKFRSIPERAQETIRILIDREHDAIIDNSTT